MFWPDPTHQSTQPPTHPPNHTPTHGWEIFHKFQIFKRNWNILISSSIIKFLLIPGVHPLGVVDGWMGVGVEWVWVCGGVPCTCMHTHVRTCMLNMINMLNMDASMSAAICNFYTCIHVHACMCMHVRACGDTPPCPQMPPDMPHPPAPSPELQGGQNTKIQ